jgi:hypothetical protein
MGEPTYGDKGKPAAQAGPEGAMEASLKSGLLGMAGGMAAQLAALAPGPPTSAQRIAWHDSNTLVIDAGARRGMQAGMLVQFESPKGPIVGVVSQVYEFRSMVDFRVRWEANKDKLRQMAGRAGTVLPAGTAAPTVDAFFETRKPAEADPAKDEAPAPSKMPAEAEAEGPAGERGEAPKTRVVAEGVEIYSGAGGVVLIEIPLTGSPDGTASLKITVPANKTPKEQLAIAHRKLRRQLPEEGVSFGEAWRELRPILQQRLPAAAHSH